MSDLEVFVRNQLRQAAAEFLLEQVATVADEITGQGEDTYELIPASPDDPYIPEVEMGGARDFGDKPLITPEREAEQEVWLGILGNYQKALQTLAREGILQADQDPGDSQPADLAGYGRCDCPRSFRNNGRCGCGWPVGGGHRL